MLLVKHYLTTGQHLDAFVWSNTTRLDAFVWSTLQS